MKHTLTTILCLLLAIVLSAGAVCIGARNGWLREREEALAVGTDAASYEERAMDAANLHVVAARHLPAEDPLLVDLLSVRTLLQSQSASSEEKAQADMVLTTTAQKLAASLPELSSVQASDRDQVYISALTHTLTQGRDAVAYAVSARDFNSRLTASLTGRLAMMLGVTFIDVP